MGSSIPNAETKKADRGGAKIANVDPSILARFGTWEKMKKESVGLLAAKGDRLVRNYPEEWNVQIQLYKILQDKARLQDLWRKFLESFRLTLSSQTRAFVSFFASALYFVSSIPFVIRSQNWRAVDGGAIHRPNEVKGPCQICSPDFSIIINFSLQGHRPAPSSATSPEGYAKINGSPGQVRCAADSGQECPASSTRQQRSYIITGAASSSIWAGSCWAAELPIHLFGSFAAELPINLFG